MLSNSGVEVSSKALISLQGDLNNLSQKLQDLYERLQSAMSYLHEDWRDEKYDEFEEEFRSSREMIDELSARYKDFANKYLPPRIKKIQEGERLGMGVK